MPGTRLPPWSFLLDRGVNFRTKRGLLTGGFSAVLQLTDVGLTGLATDPEIFAEAQRRRLILITKDTDFIRQARYALGHDGILYVVQSKSELQDTIAAAIALAAQYTSLANLRFVIQIGGQPQQVP
jgi:predicted nuclease of predicted toxin-antitoxin system